MKKFIAIAALSLILAPVFVQASPATYNINTDPGTSLASCQNLTTNGIAGLVGCLIGFMNNALYLIMAASVLYTVWGAFQLMQEKKRDEAKKTVMYGLIGLFVMISIWGLVNILDKTFNLAGDAKTPPALVPRS